MRKILLTIMMALLFISLVSAAQENLGTYQQNEEITLLQVCGTCTYNNITSIILPNATQIIVDETMTKRGAEYTYNFNQTDLLGTYLVNGVGDLDGTDNAWAYEFYISIDGNELNLQLTFMYMFLILFLIGLGFLYHHISNSKDLECWSKKLKQQYQDRNFVKMTLGVIGYHVVKNKFIIYYLIGLPIIVTITQLSLTFNIDGFHTIFQNLLIVYMVGVVVVGIVFLSYIQEWFMDLLNEVRDLDWGIEK